jgi:hypothetical protein
MTFSLDTTIHRFLGYMYEYRKKMLPMQELETSLLEEYHSVIISTI